MTSRRARTVADARNRAVRSLLQQSAIAAAVVVVDAVVAWSTGGTLDVRLVAGAAIAAACAPAAALLHRLYLDGSPIPSAEPPADPGPPAAAPAPIPARVSRARPPTTTDARQARKKAADEAAERRRKNP